MVRSRQSGPFGTDEFERYYQAQSDEACRATEELLRAAGVLFTRHDRKGAVAESIMACARERQCDSIVMGAHGAGYISGIHLGSVATQVIDLTEVPVTLVKSRCSMLRLSAGLPTQGADRTKVSVFQQANPRRTDPPAARAALA